MNKNKLNLGVSFICIILLGFALLIIGCGGGTPSTTSTSVPSAMTAPPVPQITYSPDFTPIPTPVNVATPSKIYAVLVGIANYPGTQADLTYTAKDANDFEDCLKDCGLWNNAVIVKLLDDQAAKNNIKMALLQACASVPEDGMVVFFYSGHGTVDQAMINGYLVSYDAITPAGSANLALCVSPQELEDWFKTAPLAASKLAVIDSCYSGTMIGKELKSTYKMKFIPSEDSTSLKFEFKGDFVKSLNKVDNLIGITACAGWQVAYEIGDLQNSLLVYYVVQGLGKGTNIGPADKNKNNNIAGAELFNYTAPLVMGYNASIFQTPQFLNTGSYDLMIKKN